MVSTASDVLADVRKCVLSAVGTGFIFAMAGFICFMGAVQTPMLCTNTDNLVLMAFYAAFAFYFNQPRCFRLCSAASFRLLSYVNCGLCAFTIVVALAPLQAILNTMLCLSVVAYEVVHSGLEQAKLLQEEATTQTSELGPDFVEIDVNSA